MIKGIKNTKKVCGDCGKELPEDSKFCQYCGSSNVIDKTDITKIETAKKCSSCGKVVPDDSKFCPYCGSGDLKDEETSVAEASTTPTVAVNKPINIVDEVKPLNNQNVTRTAPTPQASTTNAYRNSATKSNSGATALKILMFMFVLMIIGLCISSLTPSGPEPVEVQNGQFIVTTSQPKKSSVTFNNSSSETCYVYLDCTSHGSSYDIGFIVKPKQKVKANTPAATYKVYCAIGTTWYGKDLKFGKSTEYIEDKETIDCSLGEWTVTYTTNAVSSGSLKEINESSFPG